MTEQAFLAARYVSRETLDRFRIYEALLRKWNPAINLVAKSTLEDIWSRHFLDSAQIYDLAPSKARSWADLGSGGGFPGLIVAILAAGEGRALTVTLVESDQRKAAFLMAAARELGLQLAVRAERIESLPPLNADVLSARALAPLDQLIGHAERHLSPQGAALFPKGASHAAEMQQALEKWQLSYETVQSVTDADAVIYQIVGVSRA
jgi:16S rRNA (guanine527-N7)-methyltransferase